MGNADAKTPNTMNKLFIIGITLTVLLFITAGLVYNYTYTEPKDYYDTINNPITPYIG